MAEQVPQPWRRVGLRSEKDYRVFRAKSFDVEDPRSGAPYVRTVLEAPDWVNVLALTTDQQVVLVRQFRFGVWANTLEIPGGMVDPGEDPATTARRELEEETGFRASTLTPLSSCQTNPALFTNRLHGFLAEGCVQVHQGAQEPSEDLQVVLAPRARLLDLVRSGEIEHALVLATVLSAVLEGHL